MAKQIKIKSIAFNLADPFELTLYNHARQFTVFSSYMKRLIQRDLEGGAVKFVTTAPQDVPSSKLEFDEKGFI